MQLVSVRAVQATGQIQPLQNLNLYTVSATLVEALEILDGAVTARYKRRHVECSLVRRRVA